MVDPNPNPNPNQDHNNTVDFVEFCHVIFPDIDEHELLEVPGPNTWLGLG